VERNIRALWFNSAFAKDIWPYRRSVYFAFSGLQASTILDGRIIGTLKSLFEIGDGGVWNTNRSRLLVIWSVSKPAGMIVGQEMME
jgi:hypothetical protein